MENDYLLKKETTTKIKELTKDGWEFTLHFGDHSTECPVNENTWEADFTRKMKNGLYDNHKCGYSLSADEAVNKAYSNIKNGVRLTSKQIIKTYKESK